MFKVFRFQQILKLCLFFFSLSLLLMLSKENFESVKTSISVFLTSVMPSLFPFVLFTEIILNTEIISLLSKLFGKPLSKLFLISKSACPGVIIGYLCGFPMGAKAVNQLYEERQISKKEGQNLLSFINNCNPAFILSTIGIAIFYQLKVGIILLISHILSSVLVRRLTYSRNIIHEKPIKSNSAVKNTLKKKEFTSFFDLLKHSIFSAFITMGNILGFIILFNLLFNVLKIFLMKLEIPSLIIAVLSSLFEVTRGCKDIYDLSLGFSLKVSLTSFALGFSGLCILCQIYATVYQNKFSFTHLFCHKLLQGIFSFIITYVLLLFIPITDTLAPVYGTIDPMSQYYLTNMKISYLVSTFVILMGIGVYYILDKKWHKKR